MHSYRPYRLQMPSSEYLGSDFQLVVPRSEVDLGEHLGPIELIKQIFDLGKWILVLDCNFIEGAIVNAHADGTVLFAKNRIGDPQGEALGRINPFLNCSSSCFFNSANSSDPIL
mgnify:CR=1 FL=1